MITAAEVAMMIKLGADIDISDYGYNIEDMIPFFDTSTDEIAAEDDWRPVTATTLKESVSFRWSWLEFHDGDLLKTEDHK